MVWMSPSCGRGYSCVVNESGSVLAHILFSKCEGMNQANVITLIKREEELTATSLSCGSWKHN